MKLHTTKGYTIIQGLALGPVAENIIHFHHEKWDGSGYPEREYSCRGAHPGFGGWVRRIAAKKRV